MRIIYLILVCFAAPVAALMAWVRGRRDPQRRERLADRFGRPQVDGVAPTLWIHAASMGEVQAGAVLVRELSSRFAEYRIVMTTMTTTGAQRVQALFGSRVVHCFLPYDLPFAVSGFLNRVRPQLALILETELWPNLLRACGARGIPVVVANARISPRTANRYRRLAGLFRKTLQSGVSVAAQSSMDAERFKALGARDVQVTGNLKFDIAIPSAVQESAQALRAEIGNRFVWVAGSTHLGEESAALQAHSRLLEHKADALLILVPRHPQRFEEVRALLNKSGMRYVARSTDVLPKSSDAVLFGDSMGELLTFYGIADLVFVGGSLVAIGGHNLLEPAALGVPIVTGPHLFATQEVADLVLNAGAAECVTSADALGAAVVALASDADHRHEMGRRGSATVRANRGATERTLAIAARFLHAPSGTR